ncbi:MAG TPA: hypothetical protein VLC09_07695 [Polyangiaceae bacterium]|nr:hypothetical protein [Polyangiaceae bacterium]
MLRASRASAALIRSLILGTVAMTSTVAVSSVLVACGDENQPEYWLDKLEDPKWRPRAAQRLTLFLSDALTKADQNKEDPKVKALEDKLVGPLTDLYVKDYGSLDTATRVQLIKLLADFRDPRTLPALKTAFEEFAKRPRKTTDESDIQWAVRAYADMKSPELAPAVLKAFTKLEAHTPLGMAIYRDYSEAMVTAPSTGWGPELIELLGVEIKNPASAKSKEQQRDMVDPFRDQLFWQTTAAQILGELKDPSAVEPLLKVLYTPAKGDLAFTSLLALVKIGKPAVDRTIKVLDVKDSLAQFYLAELKKAGATETPKGNPAVATAAAVLGMAGRREAIPSLIAVLEGTIEDTDKALVARELTKIPSTPESEAAFKKAFESLPLETAVQGTPALALLADAAAMFYDSTLVDWLLAQAKSVKGAGEEKTAVQQGLVVTALKLAKPEQWAQVSAAAHDLKMDDLVKGADAVVKACGDKVDCYVQAVEKSENQEQANQLAGIKAAYMVGVLGNAAARDKVIEGLNDIENGSIRAVLARTIDFLTPKGDASVVEKLEAIIVKNRKSPDAAKSAGDGPVKEVAYRLAARS